MKWIKTVEAQKILNRSSNGVRFLARKYGIRTKTIAKGNRQVCLFSKTDCDKLAPKLGQRKFANHPNLNPIKEKSTGYMKIYWPAHPRAMCDGYVYEHWIVAEEMLGRDLTKQEQVHHINRIRDDNRPENLHVYPSRSAHMKEAHNQLKEFLSKVYSTPTEKAE